MFLKNNKKKIEEEDLLGPAKRVMTGNLKVDFDYDGFAEANIFNRLSRSSDYGFYYWPYGYLFRHFRWGTVNELGFRNDCELWEVRDKYKDYFVIGFFGGSTGYDVLVPDHESLVHYLENILNKKRYKNKKVKIINLSQPGNLVLNQVMNCVQFSHLIKPDMIISHAAANDLCTMQMNDPCLVGDYQIGYPDVLEAWGKKIHNAVDEPIDYQYSDESSSDFRPAKERVNPRSLIYAFTHRVKQFGALANDWLKCPFIVGLQPWITSKGSLSEDEKIKRVSYNKYYQKIYNNVEYLYEHFSHDMTNGFKPYKTANLHHWFGKLDDSETHFGDTHHLLAKGNLEAAKCYAEVILNEEDNG